MNINTDPPPHTVIVKVSGQYSAYYGISTDGTGTVKGGVAVTVDNSIASASHLNDSATGANASIGWNSGNVNVATRRTKLTDQGAVITVNVPITMETHGSISGDWSYTSQNATVTATPTVTVTPVVLDVGGTTKTYSDVAPPDLNILIGQGCQPRLSASPYTFANYQWSISGDKFDAYLADVNGAQLAPFGGNDIFNDAPLYFYLDGDPDYGSDESISVTAWIYDGPAQIGTVTEQKHVVVWEPSYYFTPRIGTVYEYNGASGPDFSAGLWDGLQQDSGIIWDGAVAPDPLFNCRGQGQWAIVQIWHPGRWAYSFDTGSLAFSLNGLVGLDKTYPYEPAPTGGDPSNFGWRDNWRDDQESDPNLYTANDSPGEALLDDWVDASVCEPFQT